MNSEHIPNKRANLSTLNAFLTGDAGIERGAFSVEMPKKGGMTAVRFRSTSLACTHWMRAFCEALDDRGIRCSVDGNRVIVRLDDLASH